MHAAGVEALTDEQIVADSFAVRDNLTERANARRNGTGEPPLQPGLLARIDERCRVPEHARNAIAATVRVSAA